MINSVFRKPAVIQSIIIVFLSISIHVFIRRGLPLIHQQSLKMLLLSNSTTGSWAGPRVYRNSGNNCNCQPSAQLVCWGNQCRGVSWLQAAASKGCTATASLHRWDSLSRAPTVCTPGTAAGTCPKRAWRCICGQHCHCCYSNVTPGWLNDTLLSVPAWKLPDKSLLPFTQPGLDWAPGEAPQSGGRMNEQAPVLARPPTAGHWVPPHLHRLLPSVLSCQHPLPKLMASNRCAKQSEILKPHKWGEKQAAQCRGEKNTSAPPAWGELQCQILHC